MSDKDRLYGQVRTALQDTYDEVIRAIGLYPASPTAHHAHGIIREELDTELWAHVCARQGQRDVDAMRREAIQVAAMAIRFVVDICDNDRGQK